MLHDDEKFVVSVTPAIAMVFYALARIPTTLMLGWKGQKEQIVECMHTFISDHSNERTFRTLENALARIRLVALQKPISKEIRKSFLFRCLMLA